MEEKTYKAMIGLRITARSRGEMLDKLWKLIPEEMKPYVDWVTGDEIRPKGWWAKTKEQLTSGK